MPATLLSFALGAGALLLLAMLVLVLPLMRRRAVEAADPREREAALYRHQLDEVDQDLAAGRLPADQADATRAEIQRRLHRLERQAKHSAPAMGAPKPWLAVAMVVLMGGLTGAGYAVLGQPGLLAPPAPSMESDMEALTDALARRMVAHPEDAQGWAMLARSEQTLGRYDRAVQAYERALRTAPSVPAAMLADYGEALVLAADGTVPPRARAVFSDLAAQDVDDPRVGYFTGLAALQDGDTAAAMATWEALLARPDAATAPWRVSVAAQLAQAREAPEPSGPTAADMEAAASMDEADRTAMIRGMVDGLAARLEEDSEDGQGWLRLARARLVLGEPGKALEAAQQAVRVLGTDHPQASALLAEALSQADMPPQP